MLVRVIYPVNNKEDRRMANFDAMKGIVNSVYGAPAEHENESDTIDYDAWAKDKVNECLENISKALASKPVTNYSHYIRDLYKVWHDEGTQFAATKDGKVMGCPKCDCTDCVFYKKSGSCNVNRKAWLDEEYKEPTNEKTLAQLAAELFYQFHHDLCDDCKRVSCLDCEGYGDVPAFDKVLKELQKMGKIDICDESVYKKNPVKMNPSGENWDVGIDRTRYFCEDHDDLF